MNEEELNKIYKNWEEQPMFRPKINSIKLNLSLGMAGEPLNRGKAVLSELCGQTPVDTYSKQTWKKWNIRRGQAVGAKITVRGEKAYELLMKLFHANEYKLKSSSIDDQGNFAFGVSEHIDIPGMNYDPNVGIYGFDVIVQMKRAGYRVKDRSIKRNKIPKKQFLSKDETMAFLIKNYNLTLI